MSSWIVHLKNIPPEGLPIRDSVNVNQAHFDEDVVANIEQVTLDCTVKKISGGFILEGKCAFSPDLVCARCLEAFSASFNVPLRLRLINGQEDDDPGTFALQDYNLDVTQLAEEMCQLHVPMKPLCSEECAGLCPSCGCNLNTTSCGCAASTADPRLKALFQTNKEINHG